MTVRCTRWMARLSVWLVLWMAATTAQADDRRAFRTILQRHAASIVTVSYALSVDFMGGTQRAQGEVEGVVIDAGLILVPSNILNPGDQLREMMASDPGTGSAIPNIKSSEFLVRVPGADEPLHAQVLTQDRDFGLAWLRLVGSGTALQPINLGEGRDPEVGEAAFVLNQVSELFAYAPYVARVDVQGRIDVPYAAYVTNAAGKLLFDRRGRPLGYAVQRVGGNPNLVGSGGFKAFGVLIPTSRLRELTERARRALPPDGDA